MGHQLVPADEDEDPEHPHARCSGHSLAMQHLITQHIDVHLERVLLERMQMEGGQEDVKRIRDLQHKENDHGWMWALSGHKGPTLCNDEYIDAVKLRLGTAGPLDPVPCAYCGVELLDSGGQHSTCCARGEI